MSRSWPTLLAALLLGAALGAAGSRGKGSPPSRVRLPAADSSPAAGNHRASSSRDSGKSKPGRDGEAASASASAAAYAAAWDLLTDGRLPRSERLALQKAMLEEWCLIDLQAALHAAFADDHLAAEDPFSETLIETCLAGIHARPDLAWELIESRRFGLHTHRLRLVWISAMADQQPLRLIGRLPDLPKDQRHDAIHAAVVNTHHRDGTAPGKDEVAAAVLALRGTADEKVAMEGFASGLSSSVRCQDLRADFLRQQDPDLRAVYLDAYAQSFEQLDKNECVAELDSLPAPFRAEVEQVRKAFEEK